jgi:hypothetical protein
MLGGMGLFQALSTRRHAAESSEGTAAVSDSL